MGDCDGTTWEVERNAWLCSNKDYGQGRTQFGAQKGGAAPSIDPFPGLHYELDSNCAICGG
jgi:hypothetical protein